MSGANQRMMRAARFDTAARTLTVQEVPVPTPGPGVLFGVQSHSMLGHLGYAKKHLDDLVTLVGTKRLDVSRSVTATMPLEEVARGVERLVKKEGNPIRLVITP